MTGANYIGIFASAYMQARNQVSLDTGNTAHDEVADRAAHLARVARALAAEPRLSILMLLNARSLCVCALAARLGLSQPAVSQHLRVLREAGLITPVKQANYVHYRPVPGALESWRDLLCDCCCCSEHEMNSCCGSGI